MPKRGTKTILVTGSTGQIGSELTVVLRDKYGSENVVAAGHIRKPDGTLSTSGPFEIVDITEKETIERVVKKYDIDTIYHLAAVLSAIAEEDPRLAWHVNMEGLRNVLDVAVESEVHRVFWPSSIAVFGSDVLRINTPQDAALNPVTMYGVTKVAGDLLCNYYNLRFGLDVRCVRYPGIISSETSPGGGTTDYAVAMFYESIRKKSYTCFVKEDTVLPMMYMPDCLWAALQLMEADSSRVRRHMGYNLTAMSFSAGELATEIEKHVKEFRCNYKPDFRQKIADSWPMSIDDAPARRDWSWKPTYDLASMTEDMIKKLTKRLMPNG